MKRILLQLLIVFTGVIYLNAAPVSLYVGSSTSFCFPIIKADVPAALTSPGFAGTTEVGVDVLGWQFGGLFSGSLWWKGESNNALMKNFMSIQLGLAVSKEFDSASIPIFPDWFGFHPTVSARYGIFHTEHYRTSSEKQNGNYHNNWDQVLFINAGLFVDFYPGNYAALFVGADVTGWYDESSASVIFAPLITTGVKVHPNRAKHLNEKKRVLRKKKKETAVKISEKLEANLVITDDYFEDKDFVVQFELSAGFPKNAVCKNWKIEVFDSDNQFFFSTGADSEIPLTVQWDGMGNNAIFPYPNSEYSCKFTVTDNMGNTAEDTKVLYTALKVKKLGGNLMKLEVPPIIFSADHWSLDDVSPKQKIKNEKILDSIAHFLTESPYQHIYIIGHANNVRHLEEDEETLWIPLSKARTAEVRKALIERGVDADKISTEAKGGRVPISTNKFEAWRNRRIEFIIEAIPEGGTNEK